MKLKNYKILIPIFLLFTFVNDACKKISKHPLNLYGIWVSSEGYCGYMYLEINRNNIGTYGTDAYYIGCSYKKWTGKVRYNSVNMFIGSTKMTFIKKPELNFSNDSAAGHGCPKNRILATMTIQLSKFHNDAIYNFKKIKDY
ncbi:MAG: hypothetical protein IPM51_07570 [Sphingobacteriaceae bacterium]|nr:hypothetical protein [Sphingobacteriaceae bacterium]